MSPLTVSFDQSACRWTLGQWARDQGDAEVIKSTGDGGKRARVGVVARCSRSRHNHQRRHLAEPSRAEPSLCSRPHSTYRDIYALEPARRSAPLLISFSDLASGTAQPALVLNPTLDAISGRITQARNRDGRYITLTGTAAPPQRRRRRRRRAIVRTHRSH